MIKIIGDQNQGNIIEMKYMKSLQVGVIVDNLIASNGHYVMRTASKDKFEVIDLSNPQVGGCWTGVGHDIKVRLLGPGEEIMIKLFNG